MSVLFNTIRILQIALLVLIVLIAFNPYLTQQEVAERLQNKRA